MSDKPSGDDARAKRVLVLQGGGALGSYQAGVYEALHKYGYQPDWIAGTSIGAVNAAIIAGNAPGKRVDALREFWELVSAPVPFEMPFANQQMRTLFNQTGAAWVATFGVPGFFLPRVPSPLLFSSSPPGQTSFYDTAPLRATLEKFVDFERINAREIRLDLGAVNVHTGQLKYFCNSGNGRIGPEHVMASGALPPGFPPIEVDGEYYWDGGVVSNTPLERVLDTHCDGDLQIFQVDLFSAKGPLPRTILEATEREKDIRYSSRTSHNMALNLREHDARAALRKVLAALPAEMGAEPEVQYLKGIAVQHCIQIVQLTYRRKPYEGSSRDYEFSKVSMEEHWRAGAEDVAKCMRDHEKLECCPRVATEVMDVTAGER